MALQHKSGSQTAVNWISCTDDSKTEQNKYQDKWGKKFGLKIHCQGLFSLCLQQMKENLLLFYC